MRYVLQVATVLVLLLTCSNAQAARKVPKLLKCKPFEDSICVKNRKIPAAFKTGPAENQRFLAPLRQYQVVEGSIANFPELDPAHPIQPEILVPAGIETVTVCRNVGNTVECTVLTMYKDCPSNIPIQNEGGTWYNCDLDCSRSIHADNNGNCDCDVLYNTCTPRD